MSSGSGTLSGGIRPAAAAADPPAEADDEQQGEQDRDDASPRRSQSLRTRTRMSWSEW